MLSLLVASTSLAAEYAAPQGWVVKLPPGWKSAADQRGVMFGHDTEAGMILAWFAPGSTWDQMQQAAAAGIHDATMSLDPKGRGKEKPLKGGRGLFLELSGADASGTPIKARAVGILGPSGSVGILGLTTPQHYDNLKKRVDAIAASLRFRKAKSGGPGTAMLNGALCYYSSSSNHSSTRRYNFDGRGNVTYGSELTAGGTFTDGYGTQTGSWGGHTGNQYQPSSAGSYQVNGNLVTIQFGAEVTNCTVHFRQQDGRITEMMCGSQLWGQGLCE